MKALAEFTPSARHRNGLFPWCKACKSSYQANYINAVPKEERAARYTAYKAKRDADKEARAKFIRASSFYSLKRRYGISEHRLVELSAHQGNVCAVCGATPDTTKKRGGLHVDHDHVTGKVRGLLCEPCNLGMGFFKDDPDRLLAAVEYLKVPPSSTASFTEDPQRPTHRNTRNPEKMALLRLTCRQCGKVFERRAGAEFAGRRKGKEGPFCDQRCSGRWSWEHLLRKDRKLVHGTENGYVHYGCRCTWCRKAHTQVTRDRRKSK